jgi:signal transduction histidine kinase
MHESTAAMQRLVEDLLDVSTLRQGALRVHRAEHRLGDVFGEAERMLRPVAEARGVTLAVHGVDDASERRGTLDGARVVQVLSNLVGNALKFTPAGGTVEVRYAVGGASPEEEAVLASVRDTGPGIAPDDLPHIFTAYWQCDQRERRGVGLGLWIARAIVEAHGGRLRVESPPGHGATFHFALPFAAPARRWED